MNAVLNGRQSFEVVYQPIRRLVTRETVGYEALSRFPVAEGLGPQSPDVWFQQAEEMGLGTELEALAVSCAIRAVPRVSPKYLSVNVSADTLLVPAFADVVLGSLPQNIVVELTEHEAIESLAPLLSALERIRGQEESPMVGVRATQVMARLAIDDVGAGYSGLVRIIELHPDILKLDRSLISDVDSSPIKAAMIAGMVIFSAAAEISLVAEGVETEEELEALVALGVEFGQGWLLGRPGPLEGVASPCQGPL